MGRSPVPRNDDRFFGSETSKGMGNGRASLQKYKRTAITKLLSQVGNSYYNMIYLVMFDPVTGESIVVKNVEDVEGLIYEVENSSSKRTILPKHVEEKNVPGEDSSLLDLPFLSEKKHLFTTGPEARESIQPILDKFGFIFSEQEEYEQYKTRIGAKFSKKIGIDLNEGGKQSTPKSKKRKNIHNKFSIPENVINNLTEEENNPTQVLDCMTLADSNIYKFISRNFNIKKEVIKKRKVSNIQFPGNLVAPPTVPKYIPPVKIIEEGVQNYEEYTDIEMNDILSKARWFIDSVNGNHHQQISFDDENISGILNKNDFDNIENLDELVKNQIIDNFY